MSAGRVWGRPGPTGFGAAKWAKVSNVRLRYLGLGLLIYICLHLNYEINISEIQIFIPML